MTFSISTPYIPTQWLNGLKTSDQTLGRFYAKVLSYKNLGAENRGPNVGMEDGPTRSEMGVQCSSAKFAYPLAKCLAKKHFLKRFSDMM